jgi:hypothetical protein
VLPPDIARADYPPSPRLSGSAGRPTTGADDIETAGGGSGGADRQASGDIRRTWDGVADRSRRRATFREQHLRGRNEPETSPLRRRERGGFTGISTAADRNYDDEDRDSWTEVTTAHSPPERTATRGLRVRGSRRRGSGDIPARWPNPRLCRLIGSA